MSVRGGARSSSWTGVAAGWAATAMLACVVPAQAASRAVLEIDRVETAIALADGVRVLIDWPADAASGRLQLHARRVSADDLGYALAGVRWSCRLTRERAGHVSCSGPVHADTGPVLSGASGLVLRVELDPAGSSTLLSGGDASLGVRTRASSPEAIELVATRMPVSWLQAFTSTLWEAGHLAAGEVDGRVDVDTSGPHGPRARASLAVSGFGLDTPDGLLAAADVQARVDLHLSQGVAGMQMDVEGSLQGGELLAGSIYVPLPAEAVGFGVQAVSRDGRWRLPHLEWSDAPALEAAGSLGLDETLAVVEGRFSASSSDAGLLGERYLSGLLAPAGLSQLRLAGALQLDAELADSRVVEAAVRLDGVNAIDGAGRFSFAGLRGHPRWTAGGVSRASTLSWSAGALYGLGLGAADLPLQSMDGEIGLVRPVGMALLGGRLGFDHFTIRPPGGADGEEGTRIALGMALSGLDLGDLSQRLGWPAFTGSIEGSLPSAVYESDMLTFDGGLQMSLFDGELRIGALAMERPFGVAPTLSANVDFNGIRLQPLTAAFGFGEITGELAGSIQGLRLLDWSPVAFDARLYSDPAFRGRQRISQRAVRDISSVGGNFLVTELQNQALRLFSSFGYRRMGISCRLADEVCAMDGIGSRDAGYTIVEGSGLPRLSVIGFGHQVDWPVLVERLRAVSDGQRPLID